MEILCVSISQPTIGDSWTLSLSCSLKDGQANDSVLQLWTELPFVGREGSIFLCNVKAKDYFEGHVEPQLGAW
jgi:hypothetical protein